MFNLNISWDNQTNLNCGKLRKWPGLLKMSASWNEQKKKKVMGGFYIKRGTKETCETNAMCSKKKNPTLL